MKKNQNSSRQVHQIVEEGARLLQDPRSQEGPKKKATLIYLKLDEWIGKV